MGSRQFCFFMQPFYITSFDPAISPVLGAIQQGLMRSDESQSREASQIREF